MADHCKPFADRYQLAHPLPDKKEDWPAFIDEKKGDEFLEFC